MSGGKSISGVALEVLQRQSFSYVLKETNPENGLVNDKTAAGGLPALPRKQPSEPIMEIDARLTVYQPRLAESRF